MIEYKGFSDKGPRNENQDSMNVSPVRDAFAACIADGVGGSNCGAIASKLSVETFIRELSHRDVNLKELILKIDSDIKLEALNNLSCTGMATTFTGFTIQDNILKGIHTGDTRLYILRNNGIKQLTEDHTEINRLLKERKIVTDEFEHYPRKNVLESALGISREIQIQEFKFELEPNDRIILSSDGFYNVVSKREIRDVSIVSDSIYDLYDALMKIISRRRLSDNITFAVFKL